METTQMKESLAGLAGWVFLPTFAAKWIQTLWYWYIFQYRGKSTAAVAPVKGSPIWSKHNSRILCLVVVLYLGYIIYKVDRSLQPTHYDTLGIRFHGFTQKQLKSNFRKASLQYHPDKVGQTGGDAFVSIRGAHEILSDPILRYAYDRFGPGASKCTTCVTKKDYIKNGLDQMSTVYVLIVIGLALMSFLGKAMHSRYWRFMMLTGMSALELRMVLSPTPLKVMEWLMPNRVTFEQIMILHQICLSIAIATSMVGPALIPSHDAKKNGTLGERLKRLEELTHTANIEAVVMSKSMLDVFREDEKCVAQLRRQMGTASLEWKLLHDQQFNRAQSNIQSRISAKKRRR